MPFIFFLTVDDISHFKVHFKNDHHIHILQLYTTYPLLQVPRVFGLDMKGFIREWGLLVKVWSIYPILTVDDISHFKRTF